MRSSKSVTAPIDGNTITERRIDIGNLGRRRPTASKHLFTASAQDDPIRVFVNVPQSATTDLMKVGVPVQISTDGVAQPIAGKISRNPAAASIRRRALFASKSTSPILT